MIQTPARAPQRRRGAGGGWRSAAPSPPRTPRVGWSWLGLVTRQLARVVALEDAIDASTPGSTELHLRGIGFHSWPVVSPGLSAQPIPHGDRESFERFERDVWAERVLGIVKMLTGLHGVFSCARRTGTLHSHGSPS